jgi:BirA family transcriptional regulator, biotin operon repressor / biotin---[acetyl-CoA-carboxylase] ligase
MPARTDFVHEHLASIDSTNAELLRRSHTRSVHARSISADVQTAGRGQRGRRWYAAAGDALLMSAGWFFARGQRLDGLSLAVGVMVARAAQRFSGERVTLKWPNDLLLEERTKLGGILIETLPLDVDQRVAVIGIGVNVRKPQLAEFDRLASPEALPPGALLAGFQPHQADGATIVRDALRHAVLDELASNLPVFANEGFAAFRNEWWVRRAYADANVRVLAPEASPQDTVGGRIVTVDENGALTIDDGRTLHTLHSGTLSIRPINA